MPVIARLRHCLIAVYIDDHAPPHFHVLGDDGREAQLRIADLKLLHGAVDRRAMREALERARDNDDLLRMKWDDYNAR